MDSIKQYENERDARISKNASNQSLQDLSNRWVHDAMKKMYVYNFSSLGRPIIQFPQDMVAVQELIWEVKPDLIIETGIAHGGSIIQSAMMLAVLDMCEEIEAGASDMPTASKRKVLAVDIDIRDHNRQAIEAHPMASRIEMIQGSAVAPEVIAKVRDFAKEYKNILVMVDSMHTHDHVIRELEGYSDLVSVGSYFIVFDTFVEDMPTNFFSDRPWDPGNNPKTAVHEWLKSNPNFEIDTTVHNKLLITVAPDGYLKRIS